MRKKGLLVFVLAATFVTGSAFSQVQFSAGGGFIFNGGRTGGVTTEAGGKEAFTGFNALGFGGFIFADATYAELAVAFMGGPNNSVIIVDGERKSPSDMGQPDPSLTSAALDISLLGKYPIAVGNVTIFPLAGFGLTAVLSQKGELNGKSENNDKAGDLSTFRLQLGIGSDFNLTESIYLRAEGLGWYGFAPKYFSDLAGDMDGKAEGGFGGTFKLAAGFRF